MSAFQRLRVITAGVGVVAALVFVGTTVFGDNTGSKPVTPAKPSVAAKGFADDAAKTVYTDKPVLTFTQADGTTAFAWQLKPTFPPTAARPKDVAVLIDTSASQAGEPLQRASQIVQALAAQLAPTDRVDVWTLNLNHKEHTRSLTGGFKAANDPAVAKAADAIATEEYAAGAVDMKSGVEGVLGAFDGKAGRQQLILYVGDGESAAGTPMTEGVRVELGRKMTDKGVQFFSVPVGLTIAANTLHGFGMLTGGKVVRTTENVGTATGRAEFVTKLVAAFDVPVLTPEKVQILPAGLALTPGQLPPLRADRATLVMGTLAAKDAPAKLSLRIDGRVAGEKQTLTQEDTFAAASKDHYFLLPMLRQWQTAESKDAPVVLPADRALAMAGEQFRLYRDEYVELALQAISADKLEHAEKLFQAALGLDPALSEAKAGVDAVNRIRTGKMTKKDFQEKVTKNELKVNLQLPGEAKPADGKPVEVDPQAIKNAQAAQQASDAEARALVEETIKRVRANRENDPDGAYEDLKRQRENVRTNDALTDTNKTRLVADLDALMRDVATRAVEIKRRNEAVRERISRARALMNDYDLQMDEDNRTKARLDRFRFLMSQARYELAYREAQLMEQERVNRGLSVPPEVYTTYRVGQSATQLREQRELKRLREDRYLLTLLQVEKSFVPYPDEPPVHFPPASVWRELRERRAPYEFKNQGVGQNTPKSLRDLQQIIEGTHDMAGVPKRVSVESVKGTHLKDVLDQLEVQFGRKVKFVIREELFRALGSTDFEDVKKYPFKNEANLSGLTLGSFLDVILSEVKGSFIVRPEYIEITTAEQRLYQKVTRAFEIGDLALAVPNSINQQALSQNLAVFGAQLQNFGQSQGQAQQFGQLGNGGGLQFGQGGMQQLGGQLGMQLGGQLGQMGQMANFGQLGCQSNLGVGGGITGVTGGQLGQFGNLGGQFGIQGNNQSSILIQVISQMVAPGEWTQTFAGTGCNQNRDDSDEPPTYYVKPEQLNSIGYYPVSNALIVRATSRYHPTQSFRFQQQAAMGAGGGNGGGGKLPKGDGNIMPQIGGPGAMNLPANDGKAIVKAAGADPKRVWNAAFASGAVTDPNLVITAVDFLFEYKEYQHAAESLKANLRKGHATGAWAYEALAIALTQSKATAAEVERAAMSAIDLDPIDPKAYLRAAKAEHDLGKDAVAIDLCRRAADIEPNLPAAYANALAYADAANGNDVKSDVVGWATMNLLRRDWPNDGVDHIATAKDSAKRIAGKLTAAGRKDEAAAVNATVSEEKHRDLIVELRWQGQADLDLSVNEPSGTDCTATQKRTAGGGVLRADLLDQDENNRSEVYTAAHAFNGKYTINVGGGLGRPVGNKASVKVTRFAGTDKQEVEVFTVDLSTAKPVEIVLDGGTRTELSTVLNDDVTSVRQISTATAQVAGGTGMTAGFGGADPATHNATNTPASAKNVAPVVTQRQEVRLPSASPALPGMRLVGEVKGGAETATYNAFPVFTGKATDIPLPKLPLLPGSGK